MNHDELKVIVDNFNMLFNRCARFCFLVRDSSFQESAIVELELYRKLLVREKELVQKRREENIANTILSLQFLVNALIAELRMWVSLKCDDPHVAWEHLIQSQNCIICAMRSHSIADDHLGYLERLEIVEQIIFPPQWFNSVGLIVEDSECSICGSEYGECSHIKGRPYNGDLCSRIIKRSRLLEVSVVNTPANKSCRAMSFSEGDTMRDIMTWLPTTDSQEASGDIRGEKEVGTTSGEKALG
jgi:hypothetical protein